MAMGRRLWKWNLAAGQRREDVVIYPTTGVVHRVGIMYYPTMYDYILQEKVLVTP